MSVKVGVLGGGGSIGLELIGFLSRHVPDVQVLAMGRTAKSCSRVSERFGGDVPTKILDCRDLSALREVLYDCDLFCNCAGPSALYSAPVAWASLQAGVPYADPSDSLSLRTVFEKAERLGCMISAIYGAGLVPGLSGILPMWFAQEAHKETNQWEGLDVYYAGKDEFSDSAAFDYADSIRTAMPPEPGIAKPHFVEMPCAGQTFLAFAHTSEEIRCIRSQIGIPLAYHNCFIGEEMLQALATVRSKKEDALSLDDAAKNLKEASRQCAALYGHGHSFLCRAKDADGQTSGWAVTVSEANALMGAMMGLASRHLLYKEISGAHYFAEILPAGNVVAELTKQGYLQMTASTEVRNQP